MGSSSFLQAYCDAAIRCASEKARLGLSRPLHTEIRAYNIGTFCFVPGSIKIKIGRHLVNLPCQSFMEPKEVTAYIVNSISFDGELISPEVSFTRMLAL